MIVATSIAWHIGDYLVVLAGVYTLVIIAYIVVNLAFAVGLRIPYTRVSDAILTFLRDVCEPYLRLFRRILPSFGGLDLSPMLAIILLQVVSRVIASALQS